jgi:hypothetical protein
MSLGVPGLAWGGRKKPAFPQGRRRFFYLSHLKPQKK